MAGRYLSLIILLLVGAATIATSSGQDTHSHHLDDLLKKLENPYSKQANEPPEDDSLTTDELKKLLLIFRGVDVEHSTLAPLLDGEPLAPTSLHGLAGIREKLEADDVLKNALKDPETWLSNSGVDLNDLYSIEDEEDSPTITNDQEEKNDGSDDREEYGDQVGGYEGCRRDYATFIEPLTDRFLYNMHTDLCDEDPQFCDENGDPNEPYRNMTSWGRSMLDALGKLPAAISDGQLHWSGSFELCKELEVEYEYYNHTYMEHGVYQEDRQFKGEYCRVDLQAPHRNISRAKLSLGICVPDTCSRWDVQRYIAEDNIVLKRILEEGFGVNVTYIWCGHILDGSSDPAYQAAMALIIIITIIVIAATIYDAAFRKRVFKEYAQYLRPSLAMYAGPKQTDEHAKEVPSWQAQNFLNARSTPEVNYEVSTDPGTTYRQMSSISTISNETDAWMAANPQLTTQISSGSQSPMMGRSMSLYDIEYDKATWTDKLEVAFVGFSLYSNLARIFSTKTKKDHLECINGIRFLSFCWLLLGHTYLFGPVYADCWISMNLLRAALTMSQQFNFQHIIAFPFHSDTFFVISGTLTTYWWLKHYSARGNKLGVRVIVYYFLHRYWRLMPAYMFGLMFLVCLYKYLGPHGVFIPNEVPDLENCRDNWWRNLLLIHNLFRDNQCMSWTMYFGMLFQLHCVAILVVLPLVWTPAKRPELGPRIAYGVLICLLLIQIGATIGVTANIYTDENGWLPNIGDWYFDYLQTPWCRAGPYIVGLALGILLYRLKCIYPMHWSLSLLGWLLALLVLFTVIYSNYDQYKEDGEVWSDSSLIAYDTFARTAWGVGIAWIIFACGTGHGSIITMFLSLKLYQPLCRLIYPGYMLHTMMIFTYMYGQFTPFYIDERQLNYVFMANIEFIYMAGIFIALWFHYPFAIGLERALLCESKLQCIMAGRHPNDDVIRYVDDRYLGHTQPWALGGAKATDNCPPGDLGQQQQAAADLNDLIMQDANPAYGVEGGSDATPDGVGNASGQTFDDKHEPMNGETVNVVHEELQSDGTILQHQISTTPL